MKPLNAMHAAVERSRLRLESSQAGIGLSMLGLLGGLLASAVI